jgi:carbonic anhydrase
MSGSRSFRYSRSRRLLGLLQCYCHLLVGIRTEFFRSPGVYAASRPAHGSFSAHFPLFFEEGTMATSSTEQYLRNNQQYASGRSLHEAGYPGRQRIQPAKHLAVLACMDARLDVEDLLGLQTGDAHIIRNAGGVVDEDAIRCLIISHHLLDTREIVLIHHTRCGMLSFTDELLKAGLEGDPAAAKVIAQVTGRNFTSCQHSSVTPAAFHAFRGALIALDGHDEQAMERLRWDVRRGMSAILNHPWIPTSGPDAVSARGFIYDVDTGKLEEVSYPGPMGSA